MRKIGLIIDRFHLENKVVEFLKILKTKAKVSIYMEESYLLNKDNLNFDEDLFFIKGKGKLMIAMARMIENETSIPVINSHKGIWLSINRFMNSLILKKGGISVPDFSLDPSNCKSPFQNYIVKNIIDQKTYSFKPNILREDGHLKISDERAIEECNGRNEKYQYFYYQKFIKSKWEYKVYGFGDNFYYYKQIPVLVNPNKMETRREIEEIPELKEIVLKAMKILDLKVASLDFLKSNEDQYYLTDINSTPNFNYIKDGPRIMADYLIEQTRN
ncbi:MAG: RimK family alpha-L-glutamate ligase [Candidatus Hodarchaeota archaeon]